MINELPVITNATKKSYPAINGSDLSCAGSSDGEITITATGTPPLQYSKDNGFSYQASNIFSGLGAGTYNIKVKNGNLCESLVTTVTITAPPAITGSETHTNVSCFGENNGQITVFASGGTGIFNILLMEMLIS